MKRLVTTVAVMTLVAACGGSDGTTTVVEGPTTTTEPSTTTAPTTTADSSSSTTTTTGPVVLTDMNLTARTRAVILVEEGDVLNVRTGPGTEYPILTSFEATHTGIVLTGNYVMVDSSRWVEVETEDARGWSSINYLTEEWTTPEVDVLWNLETPLAHLAVAMAASEDLSDWVDRRGLWAGWAGQDLYRWRQNELDDLMTSTTTYPFADTDCLSGCTEHTFATGIAGPFLDIYEDRLTDATYLLDDAVLGTFPAGTLEQIIPTEFKNLHFVGWHDPTDGGAADWLTVLVFYELNDGQPKIIGMVRDGFHFLVVPMPTITFPLITVPGP